MSNCCLTQADLANCPAMRNRVNCGPTFYSSAQYLNEAVSDARFRQNFVGDPSAVNTNDNDPTIYNARYNQGCSPNGGGICGRSPCNKSICNPFPCDPPCPNITLITTAIDRFLVPTTAPGTAPTPIPIGATSIPAGSTIIPITGSILFSPEVNSGGITYNPANGQFTLPIGGRYIVSLTLSFASLDVIGIRDTYIYKVDAVTRVISLLAGDSRNAAEVGVTRVTLTTVASFNPGDSIFFAVAQNSGESIFIFPLGDPANRFAITRLC